MKSIIALVVVGFSVLQPPNADAVRDRLDAYLVAYEPQLSTLVAEERMSQRDDARAVSKTALPTKYRALVSEVAFIGLPGGVGWLGFRRVVSIDGKKVPDAGPTLAQVLTDGARDDFERARLLLTESARHNLGQPRTTNLPNLPLEFLHPRHRYKFANRIDGTEKIRGAETIRLVLNEVSTPTLIQRAEGGDLVSTVTAWVETATGRLLRAEVKSRDARLYVAQFVATVWVDFKDDAALGLLVPVEMREEFFAGRSRQGTGTARYSNYRRFQTAARIVPPPN